VIAAVAPGLKKQRPGQGVAMILFGMINWTFTWLRAGGPLSYADMAPVVTQIVLNGERTERFAVAARNACGSRGPDRVTRGGDITQETKA
jgi:hypothetical protein